MTGRLVLITGGLSAAGALFGGLAGAAALMAGVVLTSGPGAALSAWDGYAVAAIVGGVFGAALAPLAGWLLLRRVPLGRAFSGLTVGTALGGATGWLLMFPGGAIMLPLGGAATGFAAAAVLLRRRHCR